jgi:hypothetical protein
MISLSELFSIQYGHSLELNRLRRTTPGQGIPFISRKMGDNGIAAYVEPVAGVTPNPAGDLTCALSGNGVLSTFVQDRPYYTAFHVACLRPFHDLTMEQKLFYCACIRANRYRYGWGRQANRSLKGIQVPAPDELPAWLGDPSMRTGDLARRVAGEVKGFHVSDPVSVSHEREWRTVSELFDIKYGHSYELTNMVLDRNGVNFVSRRTGNNGVSGRVKRTADEPSPAGTLSVALGGTVLETYVQPEPWYCGRDVAVLTAKSPMSLSQKLFYAVAIRWNRFRFNYGRQANRTLGSLRLPPVPEWVDAATVVRIRAELAAKAGTAFGA